MRRRHMPGGGKVVVVFISVFSIIASKTVLNGAEADDSRSLDFVNSTVSKQSDLSSWGVLEAVSEFQTQNVRENVVPRSSVSTLTLAIT